jgi:hypothetical protein
MQRDDSGTVRIIVLRGPQEFPPEVAQIRPAWNDPDSRDTTLSSFRSSFEFDRAHIADGRVPSVRIVEPFDVIEHISLGLLPGSIFFPVNSFLLQRIEEALHGRVVPDIA